ncbi:hypothetical protein BC826DRAFT_967174 [Russula brevipes]|nr:hypothetical protein BC826DRAFT_967174 [Russula brevipes]
MSALSRLVVARVCVTTPLSPPPPIVIALVSVSRRVGIAIGVAPCLRCRSSPPPCLRRGVGSAAGRRVCVGASGLPGHRVCVGVSSPPRQVCVGCCRPLVTAPHRDRAGVGVAPRWHWCWRRAASALASASCRVLSPPPCLRRASLPPVSASAHRRPPLSPPPSWVCVVVSAPLCLRHRLMSASSCRHPPRRCPPEVLGTLGDYPELPAVLLSASSCQRPRVCIGTSGLRCRPVSASLRWCPPLSAPPSLPMSASGRRVCVWVLSLRWGIVAPPSSPPPSHRDRVGVGVAPHWHWRQRRTTSASLLVAAPVSASGHWVCVWASGLRRGVVAPPRLAPSHRDHVGVGIAPRWRWHWRRAALTLASASRHVCITTCRRPPS